MGELIILGSANALPDLNHDTSHLLIVDEDRRVLVDCSGSPVQRLQEANVQLDRITDIIITHYHPDHVAGLPMLLMNMWLQGRENELNIHGLSITVEKIRTMMSLYDWEAWPGLYPVIFKIIADKEMHEVLNTPGLIIHSSPVKHLIPTIGLRFDFNKSSKSLAYSCDTEPCDAVIKLAKNVDILIHEAAGEGKGHSSAFQAAELAEKANANKLYLIHYPRDDSSLEKMKNDAHKKFRRKVYLTKDFMRFNF